MKRMLMVLFFLLALVTAAWATPGDCVVTSLPSANQNVQMVVWTWTGDSSTGAVPVTSMSADIASLLQGWYVFKAITKPGATAPTAAYDMVLKTDGGTDVFAGALSNRSATTEEVTTGIAWPLSGNLTLTITNQTDGGGQGTLTVFFSK